MQYDEEKSLDVLRQIFQSNNTKQLEEFENEIEALKQQLNDKETKINAYYPIITDLLERKIIDSEDEVAKVLSPIVGKAIKKQISESKDEMIDALYPIMGETIKKSIAESMKELYESINLKIDNALRKGIFSKQVKSKISGVSTGDLILQSAFPFKIKEIFLIHEQSGILISHVSSSLNDKTTDADIVSGMLTAIKDFVKESFASDSGSQSLNEIQYGDSRIILEKGRYSYFAMVVSGQEPVNFDEELAELNMNIHHNYAKKLREFNGDLSDFKDIDEPLLEFINLFKQISEPIETEKPKPILGYLLLGMLFLIIIIFAIIKLPPYFADKSTNEIIKAKLESVPKLNLEKINWNTENGEVTLSGLVNSYETKNEILNQLKTIPEVKKVNNNLGIIFPTSAQEVISSNIKKSFGTFDLDKNYDLTYQVNNDEVTIEGKVSTDEQKRNISFIVSQVPGVRIVLNNIIVSGKTIIPQIDTLDSIKNLKIYFDFGKSELSEIHRKNLKLLLNL
ncbi:MAG: BON domain-containing protein [Ignavibacteriales bacterium]|nr:BON domain-containing protein [Ignavibacteriales bacterium]